MKSVASAVGWSVINIECLVCPRRVITNKI